MILFKKTEQLIPYLESLKSRGLSIGFVPTMGALHQGHLSLIEASRRQTDITVASIFVNPTQFNNPDDFNKYPVLPEKDILLLEQSGCDILFMPSVATIYPNGTGNGIHYELGMLETVWEGAFRPGHFQGVCRVMDRLLQVVQPQRLFMGQKDYQQCMVVQQLIEQLHLPVKLVTCPTLREQDGLAMSSRNLRLNHQERIAAVALSKALFTIKEKLQPENLSLLLKEAGDLLTNHNFRIDYITIVNASTLAPVQDWNGKEKLVALIAAFQNDIRLIDNMLLNE